LKPLEQAAGPVSPFKRMDDQPVFEEPWQAQLLAMADALVRQGVIAPADWSDTLGRFLAEGQEGGCADDMDSDYRAALLALEDLLARAGAVSANQAAVRKEAWKQAYLSTPHGEPVRLPD